MSAVWDQYWKPSHRHIKNKNRGSRILPCGTQHFTKPGSNITFSDRTCVLYTQLIMTDICCDIMHIHLLNLI